MKYYASPDGTSLMSTGDSPLGAASVPADWTELTREEYDARIEEGRRLAEERAEDFLTTPQAEPAA
ncbi:hypothetical protein [Streptomyces sp. NPDC058548]|uniref:hypothetical protein n=1 Tax=Streptomyces sp. NPDC058548 TaxID=3346545 RepID=UPI00365EE32E